MTLPERPGKPGTEALSNAAPRARGNADSSPDERALLREALPDAPIAVAAPTPRTDALKFIAINTGDPEDQWVVDADEYAKLERELAYAISRSHEEIEADRAMTRALALSETPSATAFPEWEDCRRCGAATLKEHPEADPAVVAEQARQEETAARRTIAIEAFIATVAGPVFNREDLREEAKHILKGTFPYDTCMRAESAEGSLRLAQSALRQWTESYARWCEKMPVAMQNKLPPGNHLQALEAIEEHFKAGPYAADSPSNGGENDPWAEAWRNARMKPTIAQRIERLFAECSGVWGPSGVTSYEKDRLEEWRGRERLSEKQEAVLASIEKKVFGDG